MTAGGHMPTPGEALVDELQERLKKAIDALDKELAPPFMVLILDV